MQTSPRPPPSRTHTDLPSSIPFLAGRTRASPVSHLALGASAVQGAGLLGARLESQEKRSQDPDGPARSPPTHTALPRGKGPVLQPHV